MRRLGPTLTDNLREAVRSLYGTKLRTLLGLIGIMIGIASVITMISTGELATSQSRKEFEALGTDVLTIRKSDDMMTAAARRRGVAIGLGDALEIADAVPSIAAAAPRIQSHGNLSYGGKRVGNGATQGVTASFASVNKLRMAEGRFVSDLDVGRYYGVVGADIADAMRHRGAGAVVGEALEVGGRLFTIVGVLKSRPENYALPFQVEANGSVFVPITTARRISPSAEVELIIARTQAGVHYSTATREVQAYFSKRTRGLMIKVTSAEQLIEQMESQLGLLTILLSTVGSISLVVGGIGIMNIMLISVAERRREIGIRRALGATRGDIQRQFLTEAVILTLGGGVAGLVFGTGATYGICQFTGWDFFISPMSVIAGISVSAIAGVFFGFQPAYQAARLDPIIALQGE